MDVNDFTWGSRPSSAIRPTPYRTWEEQFRIDSIASFLAVYRVLIVACHHDANPLWVFTRHLTDQINGIIIVINHQTPYFEVMDPCETFVQDLKHKRWNHYFHSFQKIQNYEVVEDNLMVHSAGGRVIWVDGIFVAQQFCSGSFLFIIFYFTGRHLNMIRSIALK